MLGFEGEWFDGEKGGFFTGEKIFQAVGSALSLKGLDNMGNTCYMYVLGFAF